MAENDPPAEPHLPFEGKRPAKYRKVSLSFAQKTRAVEVLRAEHESILAGRPQLADIAAALSSACGFPISPNSVPGICAAAGVDYPTRRPPRPAPQPIPPADAPGPFVAWADNHHGPLA
jgi:hypothetical protein